MTDTLTIPAHLWQEMLGHLQRVYPEEGCGLLGGTQNQALRHYPTNNVAVEDKQSRYLVDPKQQLEAEKDIEANGLEVLAIYHSHPKSPAYPSPTDVRTAYYPTAFYVLVSFAYYEQPERRAYKIIKPNPWGKNGQIVEQEIEIL